MGDGGVKNPEEFGVWGRCISIRPCQLFFWRVCEVGGRKVSDSGVLVLMDGHFFWEWGALVTLVVGTGSHTHPLKKSSDSTPHSAPSNRPE